MINMKDALELDAKTIENKINEIRVELFELSLQAQTTGLEKPHLKKEKKKDIARLKTALNKK